jgi:hypothetical protein
MPTHGIKEDDAAARLIFFATAFENDVVRDEQLWRFTNVKTARNRYETSLYLRRMIPVDAEVHEVGCKLAAAQNSSRGNPPPGDITRRYYCGFSDAQIAGLRLSDDRYWTELELAEQDGIAAHLAFFLQTADGSKKERADWRTEACAKLSAALTPIKLHRCAADLGDGHHPTQRFGVKCYGRLQPKEAV